MSDNFNVATWEVYSENKLVFSVTDLEETQLRGDSRSTDLYIKSLNIGVDMINKILHFKEGEKYNLVGLMHTKGSLYNFYIKDAFLIDYIIDEEEVALHFRYINGYNKAEIVKV